MIKIFDATEYSILSSAIDGIETSLQCSKYKQVRNSIDIYLNEDITYRELRNKELADKGFGNCLIKSYGPGNWSVSIVINMRNCAKANLTIREISAVILHELGHILNEPELQNVPTFEFCFINGIQFSKELMEQVQEANCLAMEVFADSYANKHGYGEELISTFHKQNNHFNQKIEYYTTRVEKIQNRAYLEGNIITPKKSCNLT